MSASQLFAKKRAVATDDADADRADAHNTDSMPPRAGSLSSTTILYGPSHIVYCSSLATCCLTRLSYAARSLLKSLYASSRPTALRDAHNCTENMSARGTQIAR